MHDCTCVYKYCAGIVYIHMRVPLRIFYLPLRRYEEMKICVTFVDATCLCVASIINVNVFDALTMYSDSCQSPAERVWPGATRTSGTPGRQLTDLSYRHVRIRLVTLLGTFSARRIYHLINKHHAYIYRRWVDCKNCTLSSLNIQRDILISA